MPLKSAYRQTNIALTNAENRHTAALKSISSEQKVSATLMEEDENEELLKHGVSSSLQ